MDRLNVCLAVNGNITDGNNMIGLVQLTGPDNSPLFVNPSMISFIAGNTPQFAQSIGVNPEISNGKGSCLMIAGMPFQVQDTPNQIINALTRLRVKNENNMLKLRDRISREKWQEDDEEEEE